MDLQFFSNDKLAWIYPFDESYGVTLVRNGIPNYSVLSADELLDIISATSNEFNQNKLYRRRTKVTEHLDVTVVEALRLKDCYMNMKVYYGHDI